MNVRALKYAAATVVGIGLGLGAFVYWTGAEPLALLDRAFLLANARLLGACLTGGLLLCYLLAALHKTRKGGGEEMWQQTRSEPSLERAVSVISREASIIGDVSAQNELWVGGTIDGNVRARAIQQSQHGRIKGNIDADQAHLAGVVDGNVTVRMLTLDGTAAVRGDVSYEVLVISGGARVEGRFIYRESADGGGGEDAGRANGRGGRRIAAPAAQPDEVVTAEPAGAQPH